MMNESFNSIRDTRQHAQVRHDLYETSDILSIYIYRMTFKGSLPDYSYTTAIGLFNSVINFVLITLVNAISKRVTETSLW